MPSCTSPARLLICGTLFGALVVGAVIPASAVTIDWVAVGDPGNSNDLFGSGIGRVVYSYQIGKYDVTIGQYAAFLNAAAATDTYSLYNSRMASDGNIKGIQQNGSSGNYTYSVIGSADRPITYVSWFDAARFCNWLTNGQGNGSTETGAYSLNGTTSGNAVAADPGAAFRLPTENEWYKAAYYSPIKNPMGDYYAYATQSDTPPGNTIGSGTNQANNKTGAGYSVTQSSIDDPNQNYLTDVGAFSGSGSFYGTFDQNGNVFQWNDMDGTTGSSRGLRGGCWFLDSQFFSSSSQNFLFDPANESNAIGFRLASSVAVPEPTTYAMTLAGLACGGYSLFRRRKQA